MKLFSKLFSKPQYEYIRYTVLDEETNQQGKYSFVVIKLRDNTWRAYVLECPSLNGRSGAGNKIHLYRDENSDYVYVCVVQDIFSKEQMIAVAKLWARKYQRYIATGKDFNEK